MCAVVQSTTDQLFLLETMQFREERFTTRMYSLAESPYISFSSNNHGQSVFSTVRVWVFKSHQSCCTFHSTLILSGCDNSGTLLAPGGQEYHEGKNVDPGSFQNTFKK